MFRHSRLTDSFGACLLRCSVDLGVQVFAFFALVYGFLVSFTLACLGRNRREQRPDAPILAFAGRGLMAASATGACLALSAAAWGSLVH